MVENRTLEVINTFFSKYLPSGKEELAMDYPFPQYSDTPQTIYHSVKELLLYLGNNPDSEYIIYFKNKDELSEIKQIVLQYTDDGKLIFGVSSIGNDPSSSKSIQLFREIKNFLNSHNACATIEEPPPTNSLDFVDFCDERYRI